MEEIWTDIKDFPDYKVSNLGRVISFKRNKSHFLSPYFRGSDKKHRGYFAVRLSNETIIKDKDVHRLVAEAFIPNPNNLPVINHKDGDTTNNNVDNLEWCTSSYNTWHAHNILKRKNSGKHIKQYTKNGSFIKEWESARKAGFTLNIDSSSIIECCRRKRKSVGNYIWRYSHDNKDLIFESNREKGIIMMDKSGKVIEDFASIKEASKKLNINASNISGCCLNRYGFKTAGGYKWAYKE